MKQFESSRETKLFFGFRARDCENTMNREFSFIA
jgi:hypothetical protein